jgi:hypothetical protein
VAIDTPARSAISRIVTRGRASVPFVGWLTGPLNHVPERFGSVPATFLRRRIGSATRIA